MMPLRRWLLLIGLCVGCGFARISWQQHMLIRGYELGERLERLEELSTKIDRLTIEVVALGSPTHLAQLAQERQLELSAWSALPETEPAVEPKLQVAEYEVGR